MKADKLIDKLASLYSLVYTFDIKKIISLLNQELKKEQVLKNCFATVFVLENQLNLAVIIPDKFYEKSEYFIPKYQVFSLYIIGLLSELLKKNELSLTNFHNILIIHPDFVISIPVKLVFTLPIAIYQGEYSNLPFYFKKIKLLNHYEIEALSNFITRVESTKFLIFNQIPKRIPKKANQIIVIVGKKNINKILCLMKKVSFASLTILKTPIKNYFQMIMILQKPQSESALSQNQNNDQEFVSQINVL